MSEEQSRDGTTWDQGLWESLLDAVVSMAADLSLDSVLTRITEVASDLTGARYAALGVLESGPRRRLRTFITHGMSDKQVSEIGDMPTGHGLLGHIIDHPAPLRLKDLVDHPGSYGVPPNHPPMHSFLGVPVRIRDKVFGNLYLTEKPGGDFTEVDEQIVVALAAAAGVAIENARLYEEAATRERWMEASAEVRGLVSTAETPEAGLKAVAQRARTEAGADAVWFFIGADPDRLRLGFAEPAGITLDDAVDDAVRTAARTGVARRVEEGAAIVAPLVSGARCEGVLALVWDQSRHEQIYDLDPSVPAGFANQIAQSFQLARSHADEERLALFEDRDRIGRDLHDLVIQRLFAVGLSLQSTASMVDLPAARERIDAAVDDLDATIKDIRRSIFALGSSEDSADFQAEVTRMVERSAETLRFRPTLRFEGPVRAMVTPEIAPELLAVLAEALSNAAKHAQASAVAVVVVADNGLTLTVADDGRGIPADVAESGLSNMRQRAERLGGTFTIRTGPPVGTTLEWSVPTRER